MESARRNAGVALTANWRRGKMFVLLFLFRVVAEEEEEEEEWRKARMLAGMV